MDSRKGEDILIRVREAIVVEGKYDKIKLSSLVDGLILETHGFRIFKDPEQMALLRRMADTRGLLILTDSDGAGFVIRNYLSGAIDPKKIKHAYIPSVLGKEKRKEKPSKEGKLGVEGVPAHMILEALRRAGAHIEGEESKKELLPDPIQKSDLYEWGLSGREESRFLREKLLKRLQLPEYLSSNALLRVLNTVSSRREIPLLLEELQDATKEPYEGKETDETGERL